MKAPQKIIHVKFNKGDDFAKLVLKAAKAMHMGRGEASLLTYYAACSSGFTPSAKHVSEAIGMGITYVYPLRNALESKGILTITEDAIYVNWDRIRTFAALNPKKTTKSMFIKPQTPRVVDRISGAIDLNPKFLNAWTMKLPELIIYFGNMTNAEYASWRRGYKKFLAAL